MLMICIFIYNIKNYYYFKRGQNYDFIIHFPLSVNSFIKFHSEYNAEKFNKYWQTICNFYIFKNNYCDDNVSIDSLQFYLNNSFKNYEKTELLGVLSHFMLNETLFFYKIKIIKR